MCLLLKGKLKSGRQTDRVSDQDAVAKFPVLPCEYPYQVLVCTGSVCSMKCTTSE